jgi:hypothetical protein
MQKQLGIYGLSTLPRPRDEVNELKRELREVAESG